MLDQSNEGIVFGKNQGDVVHFILESYKFVLRSL